ncbi:MAG: (Fe-S)-binding protein [Candidatus Dormibacteraeota bacterium]|uniref:(Fe-S)-binding protein n=1 Tax=Candidatus Aeolococcus gillhamiae TaxID=3127015 RepID=A0A934JXQ8_9BACT|nr:(Fe-S)-binding protein [Candidatus Dormibacteraeota bacterium]
MTAIVSPACMILVAGAAVVATGLRWRLLIRAMLRGQRADPRFDRVGQRIKAFFIYVIGQGRLLRWPYAGVLHALIFWGFLVLLSAIAQAIVEALWQGFRFSDLPAAFVIAFAQDAFCVAVLAGVALALINRFVVKPLRLRGSHRSDAVLILGWIGTLLIFMTLNYATLIAQGNPVQAMAADRPFASAVSRLFTPLAHSSMLIGLHGLFFWGHLVLVFGFLVYLGYSKHLHIVTAAPNVFFKWTEPKGRLPLLDIEAVMNAGDESDQHFGPVTLDHFSWKDMLDLYTCTECGRCQTHCPAYNTGKVLSPKTLITDMRDHLYENLAGGYAATTHDAHIEHGADGEGKPDREGAVMWVAGDDHLGARHDLPGLFQPSWIGPDAVTKAVEASGGERPLFGGTIADETLWACTTCGACMDQCPVLIEHVPKIIEMRRHLVLDESRMPKQAETALRGIENVFNPYGLSHQTRADWARDLGVQFAADRPDAEYLYWVGCASSFDDRAKTIATALVKILQAGKVDFAILGTEEKCSGDPARRIGNEYLFQERAKDNVAVLRKYNVHKIITSCPHDFNTFANEYSAFGGDYEVVHHTQMIERLLKEGRITLDESKRQEETITYHDSCYLGRWNDIFAPPRDILEQIPGLTVVEMARNRSEGMCCGAGGGHMWMEEEQPRVNHKRVEQAAATTATKVATACPFCLAMFDEGIASKQLGDRLAVDDVAVYVARSLAGGAGEEAAADVPEIDTTIAPSEGAPADPSDTASAGESNVVGAPEPPEIAPGS